MEASGGRDAGAPVPGKSEDACNEIPFHELCNMFENVSKKSGREKKLDLLFKEENAEKAKGGSIYPLLRLVLPAIDNERGNYSLKESKIAKTYVDALHLEKSSADAVRLLHWKDPTKAQKSSVEASRIHVGDFATILESVLKDRVQSGHSTKTLKQVNTILDNLAGAISLKEKEKVIQEQILRKFSAQEQKWLARIIFSDLKIGLKHEVVLDRFYATAMRRYNECVSLRTVCEEEGITTELKGIKLFQCYSPMLAKGFNQASLGQVATVEKAMGGQPFLMDIKLDGERLSVHIGDEGEQVKLLTRNGNDYTNKYACMGDYIRQSVLKATGPGTRCILDGEVLAWDGTAQCYVPFGSNPGVAKAEEEHWGAAVQSSAYANSSSSARPILPVGWERGLKQWMMFVVFDIVFLEGPTAKDIIQRALVDCNKLGQNIKPGEIANLPLLVRRCILERVVAPIPKRVQFVPSRRVTSYRISPAVSTM